MSLSFDVLVVGAGPAGICAATLAAESGARVCLVDENPAPGGQIWRGLSHAESAADSSPFSFWMERLMDSGCECLHGWRVVESVADQRLRLAAGTSVLDLQYQSLIVATGARERFLPFSGWTLPGVMGAAALGAFMRNGFRPTNKNSVVLAGSGPLLLAVAAELAQNGPRPKAVLEQARWCSLASMLPELAHHPGKIAQAVGYSAQILPSLLRTGCWIAAAEGDGRVQRVVATDGKRSWTIPCDLLACGYGLVPNLELPRLMGCLVTGDRVAVGPMQQSSVPGVYCAGEAAGVGGVEKAMVEGQIAGLAAVGKIAEAARLGAEQQRWQRFARRLDSAYRLRQELTSLATPETIVCRCEDVRHQQLLGQDDWRSAKLATRCGMGACQGRVCGSAAEFLYGWKNENSRPPLSPVPLDVLAAPLEDDAAQNAPAEPVSRA